MNTPPLKLPTLEELQAKVAYAREQAQAIPPSQPLPPVDPHTQAYPWLVPRTDSCLTPASEPSTEKKKTRIDASTPQMPGKKEKKKRKRGYIDKDSIPVVNLSGYKVHLPLIFVTNLGKSKAVNGKPTMPKGQRTLSVIVTAVKCPENPHLIPRYKFTGYFTHFQYPPAWGWDPYNQYKCIESVEQYRRKVTDWLGYLYKQENSAIAKDLADKTGRVKYIDRVDDTSFRDIFRGPYGMYRYTENTTSHVPRNFRLMAHPDVLPLYKYVPGRVSGHPNDITMEDFWHLLRFHPEMEIDPYIRPAPPLVGPFDERKNAMISRIEWAVAKIDTLDEARETRIACLPSERERNREIEEGDEILRIRAVLQQMKSFLE